MASNSLSLNNSHPLSAPSQTPSVYGVSLDDDSRYIQAWSRYPLKVDSLYIRTSGDRLNYRGSNSRHHHWCISRLVDNPLTIFPQLIHNRSLDFSIPTFNALEISLILVSVLNITTHGQIGR